MGKLLFTEKQLSRMERDKEIINSFKNLRKKNPSISAERIFATIAENYNIGSAAVRRVCVKAGAHVNRKTAN